MSADGSKDAGQAGTVRVRRVGSYAIGRTVGEGTFGKVRLGTHILTHERVALKILEKSKIQNLADMKRITREIQILKLLDHPNVVKLLEVIDTPKHIYLVMEFVEGGELFDYIVAHQRVAEPEAVHFFRDIISGLDYCHKRHVIHRDLKPENLLIASDGHIKIVDFGLSNTIDTKNTLLKTACGSPCYAAPEMIAGKHYNGPCVDIWSTGVILYALTCGYLPFEDKTTALLYDRILKGRYSVPSHVSPALRDLISKMLTVDPSKRITITGTPGKKNGIIHHEWYLQGLTDEQKEEIWRQYESGSVGDGTSQNEANDICTDSYGDAAGTASGKGDSHQVSVSCLPRIDFRILDIMINQLGFDTMTVKGAVLPAHSSEPVAIILRNLYMNKHNQITATYYLIAEREWKKEKKMLQEFQAAKGTASADATQLPSIFPLNIAEQKKYAKALGVEIVPFPRNAVEGGDVLPEFWDFFVIGEDGEVNTDESKVLCRTAGWIFSSTAVPLDQLQADNSGSGSSEHRHRHRKSSTADGHSSKSPTSRDVEGESVPVIPEGKEGTEKSKSHHHQHRTLNTSSSVVNIEGSLLRMYVPNATEEEDGGEPGKIEDGVLKGCDYPVSHLPAEELLKRVLLAASSTPDKTSGLPPLGLGVKREKDSPFTVKIATLPSCIIPNAEGEAPTQAIADCGDGELKVSGPVRVEIEVCLVKGHEGLHCLKTKRLAGGVWDYKNTISALMKRISLE